MMYLVHKKKMNVVQQKKKKKKKKMNYKHQTLPIWVEPIKLVYDFEKW